MKPFGTSSFSNPLKLRAKISKSTTLYKNYNNSDHSASLVRIADQLSDSLFGVVHRRVAPSFGIVVLWVIG
ncbi:hypothetical protein H5410_003670 [Solanum commersonii]|uniref:Uncharacterized protein n=1 Tax=Solanum commersonii TaxID=4109 RepID=A0A9J6B5J6_SOLCO|nr:hypothetical protein H5410_003670 [Solanum commersonii]